VKGSRPDWTLAQKQARSLIFCVRWLRNEDDRWIEWFRIQQRSPPHRDIGGGNAASRRSCDTRY
jgi:hypothetical protein